MADQSRRFLDVWIIETNQVYREVPFTTVADWIQQGRLLADDMLRPSGTAQWFRIGDNPTFSAYIPQPEPMAANDEAEALEPVGLDFAWKRPREHDETEVDMVPLIDVSLVLLIFFLILAAQGGGEVEAGAVEDPTKQILTPEAAYNLISANPDMIWIAIDRDGDGEPIYSVGRGAEERPLTKDDKGLITQQQVMERVRTLAAEQKETTGGSSDVVIRAHEELPSGLVRQLQLALEREPNVARKYLGVRAKETK
jgi:biopolymer transport protein ExbD